MHAVWPETVVEDNNLTVHISALRRVLDQGRAGGSWYTDDRRARLSLRILQTADAQQFSGSD
jgi:hypothetical protein